MKKRNLVNKILLSLISSLVISACNVQSNSQVKVVSIFHNEGLTRNYSASYTAGIIQAIEEFGNHNNKLVYENIDPLKENIVYKNFNAIIGTFTDDVYNTVLDKKTQIPLITSKNSVNNVKYSEYINYFPLANSIENEARVFAKTITEHSLIIYSSDQYQEDYMDILKEQLIDEKKEVRFLNIPTETNTYENIIDKIEQNVDTDTLLITNSADYTSILYNLSENNFIGNIYVPVYLAKFGTIPFNYKSEQIKLKLPSYMIIPIDEAALQISFSELKSINQHIDNYYFYRDGYIAYNLILKCLNFSDNSKTIASSLHDLFTNSEFNPEYADVFANL